jgi:hypothetical protein
MFAAFNSGKTQLRSQSDVDYSLCRRANAGNKRYDDSEDSTTQKGANSRLRQPMKSMHAFSYCLILSLTISPLTAAGYLMAEQAPAISTAQQAEPEPAKDRGGTEQSAGSKQRNQPSGSFTVQQETTHDDTAPVVIRSTTRRVVVDVVVTGPDSRPVLCLTQQNFTVEEDRSLLPRQLRPERRRRWQGLGTKAR